MPEDYLHLTAPQIDQLLDGLHRYHLDYGALDTVFDEEKEALLLEGFRRFLSVFLERPDIEAETVRELAAEYFEREIPFAFLMGAFNCIKAELIELVVSNTERPISHYREVDGLFERAKRHAAKAYLHLEAAAAGVLPQRLMRDRLLIRLYRDWVAAVGRGILGDLSEFPLETPGESAFTRALQYPESMMICLDLKLCDQINEQHRVILQQASILFAMLGAERYEHAYIAYQEVVRKATDLCNLLGGLYLEADTNRINRFFSFFQASLYLPGRKFFCVINPRRLARINRLHGTVTGDRVLASLEAALRQELEHNQSWLLFTRGIAGDFYVMGLDVEPERLAELCERLETGLKEALGVELQRDLRIAYHGIEMTRLTELSTEDLHLVVEYLSKHAREADRVIDTAESEAEAMLDWLRDHYHRSIDLKTRLVPEHTDIFIQPLVTLDEDGEIHGFEVLGRFREGEGHVSAGMFIDDIIDMGLVARFDHLVLDHLVAQAETLSRITGRLFLNVASSTLEDEDYIQALVDALQGPLSGFEVIVELTEQVLLERRDLVSGLHRTHGLHFAIDDFGTGYSTLQLVIELALEGCIRYLKLDGSLTRNVTSHEASERIMHITRQMAHELGLETVVEVIETAAQLQKLRGLAMDLGQGYLLGVPDSVAVWQGKLNYLKSRLLARTETPFVL